MLCFQPQTQCHDNLSCFVTVALLNLKSKIILAKSEILDNTDLVLFDPLSHGTICGHKSQWLPTQLELANLERSFLYGCRIS